MPTSKSCLVVLQGGLGNQLFQVQAAIYYSSLHNLPLKFDIRRESHNHSHSTFESFKNDSLRIEQATLVGTTGSNRLFRAISRNNRNLHRKLYSMSKCTIISETDPEIAKNPSGLVKVQPNRKNLLDGYFVSTKIFNDAKKMNLSIFPILKFETVWMKQMSELVSQKDSIVMHVRRGDLLENSNWGTLGTRYYEEGIESLNFKTKDNLFVFTDSPERVKKEFARSKLLKKASFVNPPADSSAAESLILLSRASRIVTANSTYSLWSAILSQGARVVCPSQFYKVQSEINQETSQLNWIKVDPHWNA